MLGRYILLSLALVHLGLLLHEYIPELGSCTDMEFPSTDVHIIDDRHTLFDRVALATEFHMVSGVEILLMIVIIMVGALRERSTYGEVYLPHALLVMPALLIIGVVAIRMRHTGVLGCAYGDDQCCDNMYCPDTKVTTFSELPGCNVGGGYHPTQIGTSAGSHIIQWHDRRTYCAVPPWYVSPLPVECGGLSGVPDTAACYRYGCSYETTPVPYVGVRLIMANAILFAIVAIHARL